MYLSSLPRRDLQELLSVTCTFIFHKTKDDKLSKKKKNIVEPHGHWWECSRRMWKTLVLVIYSKETYTKLSWILNTKECFFRNCFSGFFIQNTAIWMVLLVHSKYHSLHERCSLEKRRAANFWESPQSMSAEVVGCESYFPEGSSSIVLWSIQFI